MECIFCKITNGELPSYTIYQDNIVTAFLDVNPLTNGHILIVPNKHYVSLNDLDDETLAHLSKITKLLYNKLSTTLNPIGIQVLNNNGIAQEVKHYHCHLIPIYQESEIPLLTKHHGNKTQLETIYKKLK